MARTVDAGSGSLFGVSVWWTMSLLRGAYWGSPLRSDSSAPHCSLVMIDGWGKSLTGCPSDLAVVVVVAVTPMVLLDVVGSGPPGSPGLLAAAPARAGSTSRVPPTVSMATARR